MPAQVGDDQPLVSGQLGPRRLLREQVCLALEAMRPTSNFPLSGDIDSTLPGTVSVQCDESGPGDVAYSSPPHQPKSSGSSVGHPPFWPTCTRVAWLSPSRIR